MAHLISRPLPFAALILLAVVLARAATVGADGPAQITVAPGAKTATIGEDFSLDYDVANVATSPGIGGYVIAVRFDPAILQMTALTDAEFVTKGQNIVFCDAASIDNSAGTAAIGCVPVPLFGAPGVSTTAPRALARSTFHAKAAGTSAIDITDSTLESPSETNITSALTNGSVTVSGASAQATTTPAPAPSPTVAPPTQAPVATETELAAPTSTPPPTTIAAAQVVSTKPSGGALSNVVVPQTGSGTPPESGGGHGVWWTVALIIGGVALVLAGGAGALRWKRHNEIHR